MMLHRMQNVINEFPRYYGFANHGELRAYPTSNFHRPDEAGDFKVAVHLHPEMPLGHKDGVYFARDITEPAEGRWPGCSGRSSRTVRTSGWSCKGSIRRFGRIGRPGSSDPGLTSGHI